MDIKRLVIARPSGNDTALIFDEVASQDMRAIGVAVQEEFPAVEQVLFVQQRNGMVHGQMAGGEFCGNAARSLGYLLADGKASTRTFTMSGASKPVTVEVRPNQAKLIMQTDIEHEQHMLGNAPLTIAHLEGISHAIILPAHPLYHFLKGYAARPDRWDTVKNVLDDLGIVKRPASGLIFVDNTAEPISLTPYVFVSSIETLYAETACASGSIAAASVLGHDVQLLQPSGEKLNVSLKTEGSGTHVEISGNMAVLWDGPAIEIYPEPPSNQHKNIAFKIKAPIASV